jgi:hypothetical protein
LNWATVIINGQTKYWIRIRVSNHIGASQLLGTQGWIIQASNFGTSPSTVTWNWIGQVQSFEISDNVSNKEIRTLPDQDDTESRGIRDIRKGLEEHGASLEFYPQKDSGTYSLDSLLQFATGSLTGMTNRVRALSFFASDGSDYYRLVGSKINTLSIEVSLGEPVKVSADIFCKDTLLTAQTAPTHAAEITTAPVIWSDCNITIGGSNPGNVTDFSLEINNNLQRNYRINVTDPDLVYEISQKGRDLSGSVTFNFESQTELTNMLASTLRAIVMTVGDTIITLANCKWDDQAISATPEDLMTVSIPFTAESLTIS